MGVVGVEGGISNVLPEGNLTHYEYLAFEEALSGIQLVNALDIVDRLAVIKDDGTINRLRKSGLMADAGHVTVLKANKNGGFKKYTETEIAGIVVMGMREVGSVWEWSFTGGNEIASGYRMGFMGSACAPPTDRKLEPGKPLMVDLHSTLKLGLGTIPTTTCLPQPQSARNGTPKTLWTSWPWFCGPTNQASLPPRWRTK